jgi:hypothetical protein
LDRKVDEDLVYCLPSQAAAYFERAVEEDAFHAIEPQLYDRMIGVYRKQGDFVKVRERV